MEHLERDHEQVERGRRYGLIRRLAADAENAQPALDLCHPFAGPRRPRPAVAFSGGNGPVPAVAR